MDTLGIVQFVQRHPNTSKSLFAYTVLGDVTLEYLSELFYPDIYFPTRTQSAGK